MAIFSNYHVFKHDEKFLEMKATHTAQTHSVSIHLNQNLKFNAGIFNERAKRCLCSSIRRR